MRAVEPAESGHDVLTLSGRLSLFITLAAAVGLLAYGRIAQPAGYHAFADQRILFGIPRGADVLSNAGFAIISWCSCCRLRSSPCGRRCTARRFNGASPSAPPSSSTWQPGQLN
jgi:hypothetical protein